MRMPVALFAASLLVASPVFAQQQQAGNDASTNADETFKQLIAKCEDTDVLVLRARVRLAMGRLDDQAAIGELTKQTDQGLSLCGEGKIDEAKASLNKTLTAAEAKVTEKFGQDESATVKAAKAEEKKEPATEAGSEKKEEAKPWWKFW